MLNDLSLCIVLAVPGTGLNKLVPVAFLDKLEKYFPSVFIRSLYKVVPIIKTKKWHF